VTVVPARRGSGRSRVRAGRLSLEGLERPGAPGFTLIELLIVLALMAALMAIVFPPMWRWLDDYRFRETLRQFDASMDACRAGAQRRGRAVTVFARVEAGGIRVYTREVDIAPSTAEEEAITQGPAAVAPVAVVRFAFSSGFEPETSGELEGALEVLPPAAPDTSEAPPDDELALLLPDGTAAAGKAWRVRHANGRSAEVIVDRWSGSVRLRAVASPAARATELSP